MRKVILSAILLAGLLNATDFSSMTTEQLLAMRGSVPVDERAAFKAELQNRIKNMTAEEKQALGITPGVNAKNKNKGHGVMARDGSGIGSQGDAAGGTGDGLGGGMGDAGGMGGGGHGGR